MVIATMAPSFRNVNLFLLGDQLRANDFRSVLRVGAPGITSGPGIVILLPHETMLGTDFLLFCTSC